MYKISVYMLTITNMATVRNFKVTIPDKFNVVRIHGNGN